MARLDRSSDGPVPYGPSRRAPEPAGQEPAQDATPWGAAPADGAPQATEPEPAPAPAPPPPPAITDTPPGAPLPPPVAQWAPPPGAYGTPVPGAPGLEYGRTLDRVMAWWLDGIIIGIPSFIVTALITGGAVAASPGALTGAALVAAIITGGANLIYFVAFWTGNARATPGMRLMKLQMGDARTGGTLSVQQGLVRWLALGGVATLVGIIPSLGGLAGVAGGFWEILLLITTALSPTKQGLHDRIANTALVQPAGAQTPAKSCLILVIILLGIWVVGIVALIFLGAQVSNILSSVGNSI
jgi:uncharacterized RDD family membrane protein YckC